MVGVTLLEEKVKKLELGRNLDKIMNHFYTKLNALEIKTYVWNIGYYPLNCCFAYDYLTYLI